MALLESYRNRIAGNYENLVHSLTLQPVLDWLLSRRAITVLQHSLVREQHTRSQQTQHLVDMIKDGPAHTINEFIDALKATKQPHLANLVSGTSEVMSELHKDLLLTNRVELTENLDTELLLTHLEANNVLSHEEVQSIKHTNIISRNADLLDLLSRKAESAFYVFIDALNNTGQSHLAKILQTNDTADVQKQTKALCDVTEEVKQLQAEKSILECTVSEMIKTIEDKENEIFLLKSKENLHNLKEVDLSNGGKSELQGNYRKGECLIELTSYGCEDPQFFGGLTSSIKINGLPVSLGKFSRSPAYASTPRGIFMVTFRKDKDMYSIINTAMYDTHMYEAAAPVLDYDLRSLQKGDVITGISIDACRERLSPAKESLDKLGITLEGLNGKLRSTMWFRSATAFIAFKSENKTKLVQLPRGRGPAILKYRL